MDFMFEWQEQYLTSERMQRTSEILFLPREYKIHIFELPCNVLFIIYMDILNAVDKIYTATINFVQRFNSEKVVFYKKSKHLQ